MSPDIHPTAIVHPQTELADDVVIGPYTILGPEVSLGCGTQVSAHCVLEYVSMGCDNFIAPGVYIGQAPQHRTQFAHTHAIIIGDGNCFREGFTIHRGIYAPTQIGSRGLFMAQSHVAHDCHIADDVIMANSAVLGGHTEIGKRAFLSGNTAVHQYCRLGVLAFLSGVSAVSMDIMPFCTAAGRTARLVGLNLVGLKRAGLSNSTIRAIKAAYRMLFLSGLRLEEALQSLEKNAPCEEVREMITFARGSTRGLARPGHKAI